MAKDIIKERELWDELLDMEWSFHDSFDRCFLYPTEVSRVMGVLSELRKLKGITAHERAVVLTIIDLGKKKYKEFIVKLENAPRKAASKFTAKKNIRRMIFKRDDYSCLKCGDIDNLSLDHIIPVNKGGPNRIGNLQTLCRSCNSSKSDKYIDYR